MPAKTLQEAFNAFNPRQPIKPEQVKTLFVPRAHSPVEDMRTSLELTNTPQKLLFIGHRGAGKSSEMAYLSTLLEPAYLTIFVGIYDIFQNQAVSHTEVVFAVVLRLLAKATDETVVPSGLVTEGWEKLLESIFIPLRKQLFGDTPIPADKEPTIALKLHVLVAELEIKMGTESYTRTQVKNKFEGRIAELLDQVKHLSQLLEAKLERKVLLIVEDLDKLDVAIVRELFLDHAQTLTAPYPSMIYSFPVEMRYENAYKQIEQSFDHPYVLPNIGLKHRDGTANANARETMWNILLRRVEPELFAAGVLDQAITWSGGHVKLLVQLVQQSILKSVVARKDIVQLEHMTAAQHRLRDDYIVMLKQEQIDLLRQLYESAKKDLVDVTPAKRELLENISLLEYGNTVGPWADVNPIVITLLERE